MKIQLQTKQTADSLKSIRLLRNAISIPAAPSLSEFLDLEEKRDYVGLVCSFFIGSLLIGTMRLVPLGLGFTPCDKIAKENNVPEKYLHNGYELGRLVVLPEHRSIDTLKQCLDLTYQHVIERTNIENIIAVCNPVLGRLYRRFGSNILQEVTINDTLYCLMHGSRDSVKKKLYSNYQGPSKNNKVTHFPEDINEESSSVKNSALPPQDLFLCSKSSCIAQAVTVSILNYNAIREEKDQLKIKLAPLEYNAVKNTNKSS